MCCHVHYSYVYGGKRNVFMPTLYTRHRNNSDVISALMFFTQAAYNKPAEGVAM